MTCTDHNTATAPEAATVTLRMSVPEARRCICDCTNTPFGDNDDNNFGFDNWPEADLDLKSTQFEDDEDFAFTLIMLLCGKHLVEGSSAIFAASFYQKTLIGPILVLF